MAILRIFAKILLMPIVLLLVVIKWLIELFMRFTASIVGLSLILIAASVVYCVISQRWQELFIFVLTGGGIIGCMFLLVLFQEGINSLINNISETLT